MNWNLSMIQICLNLMMIVHYLTPKIVLMALLVGCWDVIAPLEQLASACYFPLFEYSRSPFCLAKYPLFELAPL